MMLEAARAAGATDIIISDIVAEKLDFAADRGADLTIDVTEEDLGDAVMEYTDGVGADVVMEASGATPSIETTLDAVQRGGTIVLVGLASEAEVPLDILDIIDNELDVHGSFRYKNTYDAAIDLLSDGAVDVAGIIDFESPLEELDAAFQRVMEPTTIKGMITFDS